MDKSKFLAVGALLALGVVLYLAKAPDAPDVGAPSVPHDHDGDGKPDHEASEHEESGAAGGDVSGGVTKLKIEDLRKGDGAVATPGSSLTMNYRGTLLSGEEFDASYGREPFQFILDGGQVIKGWDEGIKGMKEGGKRKLTIPSSLGYGERGSPPKIPGGATLVFEVELIKVEKK